MNGTRLGSLTSLVCKVSLRGDVGGSSYLFWPAKLRLFKEVSGKLSYACRLRYQCLHYCSNSLIVKWARLSTP